MRRKIHIRQTDSYDCGAACLASVAAWWGIRFPLSRFRRECGCSKNGISLQGLVDGAQAVGLCAKALKAEDVDLADSRAKAEKLRLLSAFKAPVIAHTASKEGLLHYVVIFNTEKKSLQIMDPAKAGIRRVNIADFAQMWSGYIVLVTAGEGICAAEKAEGRMARLLRLVAFHRREIVLAFAGSISLAGIGICNSLLLQMLIDKILPEGSYGALAAVACALAILIPLSLLIGYLRDLYLIQGGIAIDSSLIIGFMRRILRMDERFFRDYPKGELESRLSDTAKIRAFVCEGMVSLGVCITTLAVVSALMFTFYSRLAAVLAACIPVYLVLLGTADRLNRKLSRKVMAASSAFESDVIDSIEGQAAIRHFGVDPSGLKFNGSFSDLIYKSFKTGKITAAINGIGSGTSQVIMSLILVIGGAGVIGGNLSLGELVSFYTLSVFFISSAGSLIGFDSLMNEALVASDRIYDITSSFSSIQSGGLKAPVTVSPGPNAALEFKDVEFRYPGGRKLLHNLNLKLEPSSIICIQGPNGSGKSTVAALMLRDCSPVSGRITYGGIDINLIDSTCWRGVISAVPQNSHLFNATIFDNIAMTPGRREDKIDEKDLKRAVKAAVMAGMGPMLEHLDKGLLSDAGPGGVALSGGEKQMILVARMLYADTPVMIFDEAASNMDSGGRESFLHLLQELKQAGKCVAVISHDSQIATLCDKVIELTG